MLYTGLCGRADDGGASWAYMPLLSFCYGLTSNVIDQKKLKDLLDAPTGSEDALILSAEASVRLDVQGWMTKLILKAPQFACQGMLWKLGDQALKEGKFALASDWYLTSTHAVFCQPRTFRKPGGRLLLLFSMRTSQAEQKRSCSSPAWTVQAITTSSFSLPSSRTMSRKVSFAFLFTDWQNTADLFLPIRHPSCQNDDVQYRLPNGYASLGSKASQRT